MNIRYIIELSAEERQQLLEVTTKGRQSARVVKRANILLMADGRQYSDNEISDALSAGTATIYRIKRDFIESGLEAALTEDDRPGGTRKLDANQEALLVSIACSKAPEGRSRWTLQLLTDRLVALTEHEHLSIETIRRRLKEKELKPWQKKMWCIRQLDADFVAQMEHILDLYAEPADPARPIVNFDEALKQLVADTRDPKPMKPGLSAKQDYEYCRVGIANIFLFFDRHRGWRKTKTTQRKGITDFAECMRELADIHYPDAEKIRVVLDNLNTHRPAALYKTFPAEEARRILRRLEFHYTPAHASWLNMVEIEIGSMNRQCLDRRIPDWQTLHQELSVWETNRNEEKATIEWMFDVDKARAKLTRAYEGLNQPPSVQPAAAKEVSTSKRAAIVAADKVLTSKHPLPAAVNKTPTSRRAVTIDANKVLTLKHPLSASANKTHTSKHAATVAANKVKNSRRRPRSKSAKK